jgi:predicted lipid-binding transport protein (Tim44 family)
MRWLLEALKAVVSLLKDTMVASPRLAGGGGGLFFIFAVGLVILMATNPGKYWWAPYVLIGLGVVILFLLLVGLFLLGDEIASGSGGMGGRSGVMLKDLDEPPPGDRRRKKAPVRRKGDAVPDWKVRPKAGAAAALLDFLSAPDPVFDAAKLVRWIEGTAVRVREAIEDGDLGPVANRLSKNGQQQLQTFLDALKLQRARQVYGKVTPIEVRSVLVDAPADPDRHAVTALVTLKSRDYITDGRTGEIREGNDGEWVVSQEFWSFSRDGSKWQLDRIRPAEEADDVLNVLNELSADRYRKFQLSAPRVVLDHVTPVES